MQQHHKFSNGGHVVHRQNMPGSKCRFSVWYDNCGFVLDIERITTQNISYPATKKQQAYFEAWKPSCVMPGNNTITKKPMRHAIPDYNDADLLACILSPYTTPDQKRAALNERSKRNNV